MDNTFFQAVLNSLDEQLAIVDRKGAIIYTNASWQAFGERNGLAPEYRWIGVNYLEVCRSAGDLGDEDAAAVVEGLSAVFSARQAVFYHEYPCHSPEEKRWFILRVAPVQGHGGEYFTLTHQNITRRKLAEERVEYSALHDALTGLSNRRHFDAFLADAWRRGRRAHSSLCLLMLDLDRFKAYNDRKGHLEGDACLRRIAEVIHAHVSRETDLSARFGGDEFALVLADTTQEGGLVVAHKLLQGIRELEFEAAGGDTVGASVGLACRIPGTDSACPDEHALIGLADAALFRAKAKGRNRIETA